MHARSEITFNNQLRAHFNKVDYHLLQADLTSKFRVPLKLLCRRKEKKTYILLFAERGSVSEQQPCDGYKKGHCRNCQVYMGLLYLACIAHNFDTTGFHKTKMKSQQLASTFLQFSPGLD